jgi:hypothetical protein
MRSMVEGAHFVPGPPPPPPPPAAAKGQIEELGEVQLVRSGAGVRAQRYVPDGPPATDRTGPH